MKNMKAALLLAVLFAATGPALADRGGRPHGNDHGHDAGQPTASVPEPASVVMVLTGLIGVAWARRRFK